MEVISREQAAKLKRLRYYTGKKCHRGHDSERYTKNGTCCQCAIEREANKRNEIREALNA